MSTPRELVIDRVHPIEYTMPLKRPYGTARGVTRASTSFLIRMHATTDAGAVIGIGEAQPRRKLTGDVNTDTAWQFFKDAAASLVGSKLDIGTPNTALSSVRAAMARLQELATANSGATNRQKPFRGCLLGLEVALLDLASRTLNISIAELLGIQRDTVTITVRTLSTQNSKAQFQKKAARQSAIYPMIRVKGKGHTGDDLDLLRLIHEATTSADHARPIWMDLNEGFDVPAAESFIHHLVGDIRTGRLPEVITLEQPVPHGVTGQLPRLQRLADELTASTGIGDIRIMPDESIWDLDDLEQLHSHGGCRAINIKTAKAGGILPSLDLARRAVEINPDTHICIGGMVGTSDITTWSLINLAKALPRLDYITAVPPSNVVERFSSPLTNLSPDSTIHENSPDPGLGARLAYQRLIPYIRRHAWYPALADSSEETRVNTYPVSHLRGFSKTQLDNHVLEREALALGLSTTRLTRLAFVAGDEAGSTVAFSWTKSTASSRVATGITSDKHSTRMLLERAGVPVPQGRRFGSNDTKSAIDYADELGYPVVLKPLRGTGGRGVVTDIQDATELQWAFDALKGTRYERRDVVVEEQVPGDAYRIFVLGNQVLSVCQYRNGAVRGDGTLTVGELLLQKHRMRMRNPHLMNRPIKFDESTEYQLGRLGLDFDSVLGEAEEAVFTLNPNFQQGGETVEVLNEVHPSILDASVQAVKAIPGLAFSGVDFIMPDHTQPLSSQRSGICELNAHPAQTSHEFPLYGDPGHVSLDIVRYAAEQRGLQVSAYPAEELHLALDVRGRVTRSGYLAWFRDHARRFGLAGWIRSSGKRSADAQVSGPTDRVAALVSLAAGGPPGSKVDSVSASHISGPATGEFEVRQ